MDWDFVFDYRCKRSFLVIAKEVKQSRIREAVQFSDKSSLAVTDGVLVS